MKTIDYALISFFKNSPLKATKLDGTITNIQAFMATGNRSYMANLKTIRETGWFPYIAIQKKTVNTYDPNTYSINQESHITVKPSQNLINKTQYLGLPENANINLGPEYSYVYRIPKITNVKVSYEIKFIARGPKSMSDTASFVDYIGESCGSWVKIFDKESGYKYSMLVMDDLTEESNLSEGNNEEKEITTSLSVDVYGYIIPLVDKKGNSYIKKAFNKLKITMNESF